ncbi:MAG: YybH family protein [Gaiellaceae bacterium]
MIEDVVQAYTAAVHGKDADAFAALYADDTRNFDMWGGFSYEGAAAVRGMAADWFASVGTDQIRVEFQDVRETVGGDVAVAHAFIGFAGLSAEGEELRSMTNRVTWGLRRTPDGWKIVHEHTSVPLGEDGKGVFQRG